MLQLCCHIDIMDILWPCVLIHMITVITVVAPKIGRYDDIDYHHIQPSLKLNAYSGYVGSPHNPAPLAQNNLYKVAQYKPRAPEYENSPGGRYGPEPWKGQHVYRPKRPSCSTEPTATPCTSVSLTTCPICPSPSSSTRTKTKYRTKTETQIYTPPPCGAPSRVTLTTTEVQSLCYSVSRLFWLGVPTSAQTTGERVTFTGTVTSQRQSFSSCPPISIPDYAAAVTEFSADTCITTTLTTVTKSCTVQITETGYALAVSAGDQSATPTFPPITDGTFISGLVDISFVVHVETVCAVGG